MLATETLPPLIDTGLYQYTPFGELSLNFHYGQQMTWDCRARFVLMLAGTQGGKTSFGPWWLAREIYGNLLGLSAVPGKGAGDYLAVTTNFDLYRLKMLPEMRRVFEDVLQVGRYWPGLRVMELKDPVTGKFWARRSDDPMWGRIILRSAAAPAGLESATAKGAWLDEVGQDDWDVTTWEAILRRLSIHQGRVLGTTTVYNSGWLKSEWYDRCMAGDPNYGVIQFASADNPSFPREEQQRARDTMPEWRYLMFYRGIFAKPAGLIYHDFDDVGMVVTPFDIPKNWRRVVGIDFGGANTALVYFAEDPTHAPSTWYAYLESLSGGTSTKVHAAAALKNVEGCERVEWAGGAPGETQFRADWFEAGVPIQRPAIADVEIGISNMIALIKAGRFRVFSTCTGLRHEFATYRRKLDVRGDPLNEIDSKSVFHRLDALRYGGSIAYNAFPGAYVM